MSPAVPKSVVASGEAPEEFYALSGPCRCYFSNEKKGLYLATCCHGSTSWMESQGWGQWLWTTWRILGPTKIDATFNGKPETRTLLMYNARSTSEQADRVWEGLFVQRSECDMWICPSRKSQCVQSAKDNKHNDGNTTIYKIYIHAESNRLRYNNT